MSESTGGVSYQSLVNSLQSILEGHLELNAFKGTLLETEFENFAVWKNDEVTNVENIYGDKIGDIDIEINNTDSPLSKDILKSSKGVVSGLSEIAKKITGIDSSIDFLSKSVLASSKNISLAIYEAISAQSTMLYDIKKALNGEADGKTENLYKAKTAEQYMQIQSVKVEMENALLDVGTLNQTNDVTFNNTSIDATASHLDFDIANAHISANNMSNTVGFYGTKIYFDSPFIQVDELKVEIEESTIDVKNLDQTNDVNFTNTSIDVANQSVTIDSPSITTGDQTHNITIENASIDVAEQTNNVSFTNTSIDIASQTNNINFTDTIIDVAKQTNDITISNATLDVANQSNTITISNATLDVKEQTNKIFNPKIEIEEYSPSIHFGSINTSVENATIESNNIIIDDATINVDEQINNVSVSRVSVEHSDINVANQNITTNFGDKFSKGLSSIKDSIDNKSINLNLDSIGDITMDLSNTNTILNKLSDSSELVAKRLLNLDNLESISDKLSNLSKLDDLKFLSDISSYFGNLNNILDDKLTQLNYLEKLEKLDNLDKLGFLEYLKPLSQSLENINEQIEEIEKYYKYMNEPQDMSIYNYKNDDINAPPKKIQANYHYALQKLFNDFNRFELSLTDIQTLLSTK